MKTKKWTSFAAAIAVLLLGSSCQDWGEMDPAAGNQVTPTLENVATFSFDEPELDPIVYKTYANADGQLPSVVEDDIKGNVLSLNNGYVTLNNPLNSVKVQKAVSMTFWMKQPLVVNVDEEGNETTEPQDLTGALIAFENENATSKMFFTANGWIKYNGMDGEWEDNNPATYATGYIPAGDWHYVALIMRNDGYGLYVDGQQKVEKKVTDFDCSKMVQFLNNVSKMYIGSTETSKPWMIDDLKIYRNEITAKEIARPNIGNGGGQVPGGDDNKFEPIAPIFFNSFDAGMNGCSIYGAGSIIYKGGAFGNVFSNASGAMRSNYLVLPSNVLGQSADTQALTIGVWVNRGNETESSAYMWAPLFTAYASHNPTDNGMPMLACQYRGVLQVNCNGWSDYTDDHNVNKQNILYHGENDWLADGQWHYYTAVFTPTTAKVYIDGEIANEWEIDGTNNTAAGLFSNGSELQYICLGGNQAWNWGDNDPGFWFDDIAIYNQELSKAQIKAIMGLKTNVAYGNTFSNDADNMTLKGAGTFVNDETPGFGKIFQNAVGGLRENYLVFPSGALSKVGETKEMTINVWLNASNAGASNTYMWSPVMTGYAEAPGGNGCPMFACQYRGALMINSNGPDNSGDNWCDYTDAQNVAGTNQILHDATDWLVDHKWHLYTAVFTPTSAFVYFDGELINEWALDGESRGQQCDLETLSTLGYVCLGGNQAWGWGDPDPGFGFDDIMVYNKALSQAEIKQIMNFKK